MKDHPQENEPSKQPTCRQVCTAFFGELVGQLVLFGAFFLIANVYFAYVAFGVGALFLILPFAMLVYFIAKKYVKKQRLNYQKAQQNKK